ncbi:hypothetical protein LZ554_009511 [Drepanopeziza brunnea f. sp. 'monogermtubi']|nr:hypothetical protein LZ554_009511 [Drepanopeziza brunnea f. sp. 'monogermtubi']
MYAKTALICALAGFASASPTPNLQARDTDPNVFTVAASRPTTAIHQLVFNAKGNFFNLNNGTSTVCPDGEVDCLEAGNATVFKTRPEANTLFLDSVSAGGQQVYVAADGALAFLNAHSGAFPTGSLTAPFKFTPATTPGNVGSLTFKEKSFSACKDSAAVNEEVWKIWADAVGTGAGVECISFNAVTSQWDGPLAYKYN